MPQLAALCDAPESQQNVFVLSSRGKKLFLASLGRGMFIKLKHVELADILQQLELLILTNQ